MNTRSLELTVNQVNFIIDMMWDTDPKVSEKLANQNHVDDIQLHDQLQHQLHNNPRTND
nr:hypothetical protein [uncultured Mediterranean phage uvMED]|tara:strand:+ start:4384 stop:4560 length:177 start_codon:yes stop_codon:yes gene_type:complete